MQKTFFQKLFVPAFAALTLIVSMQSCKKETNLEGAPVSANNDTHLAELKQFVANSTDMPLSSVTYSETEKSFVVDGDFLVPVEDAEIRFQAAGNAVRRGAVNEATQRRNTYVVSATKAANITIYADATVPAMWVNILDTAIKNWNNSGSRLYITRVTSGTANITVTSYYSAGSIIATATSPDYYGNPGKKVQINTYHNGLTDAKKKFSITHELGHAFGFTHTDGTYGTLISGTPTSDPSSIMNSVCLYWKAFTSYDLTAIRTVYPK